jgi:uncharacterized protein YndB with AHSA1/START domain
VARNENHVDAPPEAVFDVLTDPEAYGDWVVGSSHVRDVDEDWPSVGSRFHHTVGVWPLRIDDDTEVLSIDPPHSLVLQARARPLGTARVELRLAREGEGTRVTMIEEPGDRVTRFLFTPVAQAMVWLRNLESLRRLRRLSEERAGSLSPTATR